MQNKFTGTYEYMGYAIYNGGSTHEWDIEPVNWTIEAVERFKYTAPVFKTIKQAERWIKANRNNIKEEDYQ